MKDSFRHGCVSRQEKLLIQKGPLPFDSGPFVTDLNKNQRLVLLHASEAVRAVDRTVLTGLEGNLASLAASCADSIEHLTLTAVAALSLIHI